MRLAFSEARLEPWQATSLEMHGTGTPLGDPIEVGAALAVMASDKRRNSPLGFSAVKSYQGHAEPAAGAVAICVSIFRLVSLDHLSNISTDLKKEVKYLHSNNCCWMDISFEKVRKYRGLSFAEYACH